MVGFGYTKRVKCVVLEDIIGCWWWLVFIFVYWGTSLIVCWDNTLRRYLYMYIWLKYTASVHNLSYCTYTAQWFSLGTLIELNALSSWFTFLVIESVLVYRITQGPLFLEGMQSHNRPRWKAFILVSLCVKTSIKINSSN